MTDESKQLVERLRMFARWTEEPDIAPAEWGDGLKEAADLIESQARELDVLVGKKNPDTPEKAVKALAFAMQEVQGHYEGTWEHLSEGQQREMREMARGVLQQCYPALLAAAVTVPWAEEAARIRAWESLPMELHNEIGDRLHALRSERNSYYEKSQRQAAVLEALTSSESVEAAMKVWLETKGGDEHEVRGIIQAALQHAQEQVGEDE